MIGNRIGLRRLALALTALAVGACASGPEIEEIKARQKRADEQIAAILVAPQADGSDAPEPERCIRSMDWRNYRALDDRYLVFEGSRDRLWLNVLPMRCPDLRFSHVLAVRSVGSVNRICQSDTFRATDWFTYPWYRRWPWQWSRAWDTGAICAFGRFYPITERKLDAIEEAIEFRD